MNRKNSYLLVADGLPFLLYLAVIFYFSSLPGSSVQVTHDKLIHFLVYGMLGLLTARALRNFISKRANLALLSWILCAFYGISDEFHQYFVPGRSCSGWDLIADISGSSLGISIYVFLDRLRGPKARTC